MKHTKPWFVIAMHAIDGQVLLGEFDDRKERDRFYVRQRTVWFDGGMDSDVKDICRGEVHGMAREAEEADLGAALMAQFEGTTTQNADSRKVTRSGY